MHDLYRLIMNTLSATSTVKKVEMLLDFKYFSDTNHYIKIIKTTFLISIFILKARQHPHLVYYSL